jgi:16S rRNA (guanine527-N7)-methyltransferase
MTKTDFGGIFTAALELNGLSAYVSLADEFEKLTEELVKFNAHTNITAVRSTKDIIMKHYVDSLIVAEFVEGGRVIDIGCGGGFPTLPLALARRDVHITALDSTAKKLTFVDQCKNIFDLNIETLCARAEDAGRGKLRQTFTGATARAVAALNILCELALPFVKTGGMFIAMKGPGADEETAAAENAIQILGGKLEGNKIILLKTPGGETLTRSLIFIRKIRPTPDKYPRAYAQILKKPL